MTTAEYNMREELYAKAPESIKQEYEGLVGIYAIMLDDEIVYVGKSKNMFNRWTAHQINAMCPEARDYNKSKYVQLRKAKEMGLHLHFVCLETCGEGQLDGLEKAYIRRYMPKLNELVPDDFGKWHRKTVTPIV